MTYKFQQRLQHHIQRHFSKSVAFSQSVFTAPHEQSLFLFNHEERYKLVIVATNDQNFCPIIKDIGSIFAEGKKFLRDCYANKNPEEASEAEHQAAIDKALELLHFHERKYTLKYVKRNAITGELISEKPEMALQPMTEQQIVRFVSKCCSKIINNVYLEYGIHEIPPINQDTMELIGKTGKTIAS